MGILNKVVVSLSLLTLGLSPLNNYAEAKYEEVGLIHHVDTVVSRFDSHVSAYRENLKRIRCSKDKECRILSEAVLYEARGETEQCQRYVASVVVNRVNDKRFPDTVEEVIKQPKQFSYLNDYHRQKTPTPKSVEVSRKIAYETLHEGKVVGDFLWYHANRVRPKWSKNNKGVVKCNQTFYNSL